MSSYCGGRKYPAYEGREVTVQRDLKEMKNTGKRTAKTVV